jgi:hypothetical protein
MNIELRRTAAYETLKVFARQWGWKPLRNRSFKIDLHKSGMRRSIVYYYAGRDDWSRRDVFYLQINECPIGQQRQYSAAVYAPRYGLCSGWHCFRLSKRQPDRERIESLIDVVGRHHFVSPAARRAFRKMYPECAGFPRRRPPRFGAPHLIVDATAGKTEPASELVAARILRSRSKRRADS